MNLKLKVFSLIMLIIFSISLPLTMFKAYALDKQELEIHIAQTEVLIKDADVRKQGIRLSVWELTKDKSKDLELSKLNSLTDKELSDIYGSSIITNYSTDEGIIYLEIDTTKKYYIREYIEVDHNYNIVPLIIEGYVEDGKVYMKVYNNYNPPTKTTPPPSPSGNEKGKRGKMSFMKIASDKNKTTLQGVSFKITRLVDGIHETVMRNSKEYILTSGDNGIFVADNLEFGTYYLWEIKPLSGYKALKDAIEFTIDENSSENKLIVIKNNPITQMEIPKTGDITLIIILCLGISLYIVGRMLMKQSRE